jgi:hypothetical protein
MSDTSQGTGWWIASDGKWYAPEVHPSHRTAGSTSQAKQPARRISTRSGINVLGIVGVVLLILVVAYISTSDGIDQIQVFGKSCVWLHHAWSFHATCSANVNLPNP